MAFNLMIVAVFAFLLSGDERFGVHKTRFNEWHHLYLGAVIFAIAAILERKVGDASLWHLRLLGASLAADDAFQHFVQTMLREPGYKSPLAWLYANTFWRLPPVQWLNRWLDRFFS